ncbi:MAG: DUF11 domain-containing protein [Acidobacteriaceae bacterium]|nr:DUF11 domain-containing protein [Acidobacteriaceae bacterium]
MMKAFSPSSTTPNTAVTLTITLSNPNNSALINAFVRDVLPAGVTAVSATVGPCINAVGIGIGGKSVFIGANTLAANSSCQATFQVAASNPGTYVNTTEAPTSDNAGPGTAATATLTVLSTPPTLSKSFDPMTVGVNESSTLSFTLTNPNTTAALSGVAFTDALPAGLVVATPNGLSGSCGTGAISAVAGSSTITLTGGTLAANSSCSFSVRVTALATGALPNTTGAVSATESGAGLTASATLTASSDAYQLNYASNLNLGDGVVNLTNSGASAGANTPVVGQNSYGDICV